MNKKILKVAVMLCIVSILGVFNLQPNSVLAATPSDQLFDGKSLSGVNSLVLDGILYTTNNNTDSLYNGICVGGYDAFCLNYASANSTYYSGHALTNDFSFSKAPTFFQISSEELVNNFKINSMYYIATDDGTGHKINIEGYDGDTLVACVYGVDMGTSGTYGTGTQTITLANDISSPTDAEYGGLLTFGSGWTNIDTIRITNNNDGGSVYAVIDSLDFSEVTDVSVSDININEDVGTANFTVSLSEACSSDVTVSYATSENTASAEDDYTSTSGMAVIPAGNTSVKIAVPICDDTDYEDSESFYLKLTSTSAGRIINSQGECTINDNDSPPTVNLSISGSSFSENAGTSTITATLSNKSYQDVTVILDYSGTAINGTDFITAGSAIVIPAGSLSNSVTLTGIDNKAYEVDKTVIADISNVKNGTENGMQQVTATIKEDDTFSSPFLSNLTINSGTLTPTFIKSTFAYTATVDYGVTSIVVTPTAETPTAYGQNAVIKVNNVVTAIGTGASVNLAVGTNTIYIDVTSAVGGLTQRYTLTVTRQNSNKLTSLSVLNGTTVLPMVPTFDKNTFGYTVEVDSTVQSVMLNAACENPASTMTINGGAAVSGTPYGPIALQATGDTTVNVIVSTATMSPQTYTVTIRRKEDLTLKSLYILSASPLTLTPTFSSNTFSYTASSGSVPSLRVQPTANNPSGVIIKVNGVETTSGAKATVTVTSDPIKQPNQIKIDVISKTSGNLITYICNVTVS